MLTSWVKKLVLAAALAVMPLQGVAAAMAVLVCHGDAHAHEVPATPTHEQGDHQAQVAHQQHEHSAAGNDENGGTGNTYHLCCNLTAFAPPPFSVNAELLDFPVRSLAPDSLHDLFVPDRPQRPPLA